jgi:putative colanic acid biosynthesis UDP-glucose lipid carrier transferase
MIPYSSNLFATRKKIRRWPVVYDDLSFFVRLSDLSAALLASIIAGTIYHRVAFSSIGPIEKFVVFGLLYGALLLPCLTARGAYELNRAVDSHANRSTVVVVSALVLLLLTGALFSLGADYPLWAGQIFLFAAIAPGLILAQRVALSQIISRGLTEGRFNGRSIVLIREDGPGPSRQKFDHARFGYHIAKSILIPPRSEGSNAEAVWSACARKVDAHVRDSKVDEIHIAMSWRRWEDVSALVAKLQTSPFPVLLLPDTTMIEALRRPHVRLGAGLAFELKPAPLTRVDWAQKRAFDLAISTLALVLCIPLFTLIALAIRLDSPGPILFRQTRGGFNGRPFRIYKFRTMTVLEDGARVVQAKCTDPRVTRVGRWLRRTSLDELPQLFNVIKGEMSLVGPRPHALAHDRKFNKLISNYGLRTHAMPGITGLAQVHGLRGETSTVDLIRRRVDFDIHYISNRTLLLDIQILFRTVGEIFRHPNAY